MNKNYILASLVASSMLLAGSVLAVEISGSGTTSVETSGDRGTTQMEIQVQAEDSGSSGKIDTTIQRLDSKIDTVNGSVNAKIDAEKANLGAEQRVLPTVNKKTTAKVTVRGWDDARKQEVQEKVEAEIEKNQGITSAEISEEEVKMQYAVPGKFLGLIKMSMKTNVSSDAEGRVKVQFPWYRFLITTNHSRAAEVINTIFQNNESDFEFLKTKGSAAAQVEIFITISNAMHEMSKSIIQNIRA